MIKLKTFTAKEPETPAPTEKEKARFIAAGDQRPTVSRAAKPTNFRLPQSVLELIDAETARSGQNKTAVLKAALLAFDELSDNEKNSYLLRIARL